jgi:hypothetical protein
MSRSVRVLLNFFTVLLAAISVSPLLLGQTAPDLGSAASYGVFTGIGEFDNTGLTVIDGDIGTNAGSITGFPPGIYTGSAHQQDAQSLAAANDLNLAYNELVLAPCDVVLGVTMGNGQVLTSQTYCAGGASTISGELIFDAQGDPNAVFIIKIDGALDVAGMSTITLRNLAQASNIYWQVNGAVAILDNSTFKGTIVANGAIHLYDGATLEGRALSIVGAITMASNLVNIPVSGFPGSLVVVTPAAGDTLTAGTENYQIEFVGVNVTMAKRLELSLDSGATWSQIATIRNDSSAYSWNVPATPTSRGLIRITDSNGVSGTSGLFTIIAARGTLTVVRPAAGESISCGTQNYQIVFAGTNLTLRKTFEYSLDGGSNWVAIGVDSSTAQSYSWNVPEAVSTQALVRITDMNGVTGTSGMFSIIRSAAPVITMQPVAPATCLGASATFAVTATGGGLRYQWRRNGIPIMDATGASYTVTGAAMADQGIYDVVVTSFCSLPTTSAATFLTVNSAPVLYKWTESQTVMPGAPVRLSIIATGTALRYQWWKGRTPIAGANASSYTIPSVSEDDEGMYAVEVSNECSVPSETSGGMFVFVVDEGEPIEGAVLVDQTVCADERVVFTAPGSTSSYLYQWRRDGVDIVGATSPVLEIASAKAASQGSYTVKITDRPTGIGTVIGPATLTVNEAASITSQPAAIEVCSGAPATLSATARGAGLRYQWRKNGVEIPGAVGSAYELSAVGASDVAGYDVIISSICGTPVTSSVAAVSILAPATISQQPAGRTVAAGADVTFAVQSNGLGYQWRRNGVDIAGATTAVLALTAVRIEDAGTYDVVIGSRCGPDLVSTAAVLTVQSTSSVPGVTTITGGAGMKVTPHPAFGLTRIDIVLPKGVVADAGSTLGLYDQNGRQVVDLTPSFARGFDGAEFDAAGLAAGLYHCRLTTSGWSGSLGSIVVQK